MDEQTKAGTFILAIVGLQLILIMLKKEGFINWDWWIVLLPFLIPSTLIFLLSTLLFILVFFND